MEVNWFRVIIGRLFWLLLACLLAGLALGQPAWALVVGLGGYLGWTLFQMQRFQHWLQTRPGDPPPETRGLWGEIFDGIYHMQRRDKRARARLQSVIERIQASTAALSDAVVVLDKDGHLEWWNHSAERLLGLRAPDDSGQHVHNLLRDPRFVEYFDLGNYREPLDIPSPLNLSIWLQYNITRYGNGERLMLVRDVTRLHNLEQMRKDFVANVSHELRTPLTVVVGYLETMIDSDDGSNPRWLRPLHQMQQQARRMQSLLNDLLMLSRLETSEARAEEKPVSIDLMLPGIRKDALALSGDRQHDITLECTTQARIMGLETELRSAISNLVYNAVKYTQDGGKIHISWSQDDRGARLSVSDNGPGIAQEHLHRLTERFYRVDSSRNSTTGGTGLGLAIVKHVLMRHQGELQISSTLGQGSTFSCVFPAERLI
ncbi:phosphate regulon sensor histidine kinase PhoR [Halopseudomonas xiamenensis]|uniref:phosphate regulon sensor histidine kinase PhoR n=1 Tax=Halopseudomonas xiamenensis TaxID=157792 RepID=UPI001625C18F|nr:phosphate regulon sensor histidine kinase PhoR [Halopseudomonas xiamenensis]